MKAEHRKQLETNVLADRVGRMVKDLRKGPSRRGMLIWVGVIVLLAAGAVFLFIRNNQYQALASLWHMIGVGPREMYVQQDGRLVLREELRVTHKDTTPGKVARYQEAWELLWDQGIQQLLTGSGVAPTPRAVASVFAAEKVYDELYKENHQDPILGPQALYNLAIAQETLAVYEPKFLDTAKTTFETVVKEHKDSVYAKKAGERLLTYQDKGYGELRGFYVRLNSDFNALPDMERYRPLFEEQYKALLTRVRAQ